MKFKASLFTILCLVGGVTLPYSFASALTCPTNIAEIRFEELPPSYSSSNAELLREVRACLNTPALKSQLPGRPELERYANNLNRFYSAENSLLRCDGSGPLMEAWNLKEQCPQETQHGNQVTQLAARTQQVLQRLAQSGRDACVRMGTAQARLECRNLGSEGLRAMRDTLAGPALKKTYLDFLRFKHDYAKGPFDAERELTSICKSARCQDPAFRSSILSQFRANSASSSPGSARKDLEAKLPPLAARANRAVQTFREAGQRTNNCRMTDNQRDIARELEPVRDELAQLRYGPHAPLFLYAELGMTGGTNGTPLQAAFRGNLTARDIHLFSCRTASGDYVAGDVQKTIDSSLSMLERAYGKYVKLIEENSRDAGATSTRRANANHKEQIENLLRLQPGSAMGLAIENPAFGAHVCGFIKEYFRRDTRDREIRHDLDSVMQPVGFAQIPLMLAPQAWAARGLGMVGLTGARAIAAMNAIRTGAFVTGATTTVISGAAAAQANRERVVAEARFLDYMFGGLSQISNNKQTRVTESDLVISYQRLQSRVAKTAIFGGATIPLGRITHAIEYFCRARAGIQRALEAATSAIGSRSDPLAAVRSACR